MVVLYRTIGNVSNQLMQNANLYSYCAERGIRFLDLNEGKVFRYYGNTARFGAIKRVAFKALSICLRGAVKYGLIKAINFSKAEDIPIFEAKCSAARVLFVAGWGFFKPESMEAFRNYYRSRMKLILPEVWAGRFGDKPVVGLHIRRGDYIQFQGGRFFYDDATYLKILRRAALALGLGDARLLLFSNDGALDLAAFQAEFPDCFLSRESFSLDHILMSRCDYLIGPPSTFTQWASYIGSVPLMAVRDPDKPVTRASFAVFPETA